MSHICTADIFYVKGPMMLINFALSRTKHIVDSIILLDINIIADSRTNHFEEGENDGDKYCINIYIFIV